ncbi:MAG: hypothetical protein QM640_16340 [Niabella sp.]
MKKLFIALVISIIGFVACDNSANNKEGTSQDTSVTEPVTGNPPVNPADTMPSIDSTSPSATDTAVH